MEFRIRKCLQGDTGNQYDEPKYRYELIIGWRIIPITGFWFNFTEN